MYNEKEIMDILKSFGFHQDLPDKYYEGDFGVDVLRECFDKLGFYHFLNSSYSIIVSYNTAEFNFTQINYCEYNNKVYKRTLKEVIKINSPIISSAREINVKQDGLSLYLLCFDYEETGYFKIKDIFHYEKEVSFDNINIFQVANICEQLLNHPELKGMIKQYQPSLINQEFQFEYLCYDTLDKFDENKIRIILEKANPNLVHKCLLV